MRVLISGMGGELGTKVALLLEQERAVEALAGVDLEPPRRRLRRARFHRIEPRDRVRTAEVVGRFVPTVVVHLGVYEPGAGSSPSVAARRTAGAADAVLGAAAATGALEAIVVRSGIEVYPRGRGAAAMPDESVAPAPGSPFGRSLLGVEAAAAAAGLAAGAPVTVLRLAPVLGAPGPSPLGRYLRLPLVGFDAPGDPPFSVLHQDDAAGALVRAVLFRPARPSFDVVNVVAPGVVRASQAARIGGRIPVPVLGPGWELARRVADLAGAAVPDHLVELLRRGRCAAGDRAGGVLGGFQAEHDARAVVEALYEWAPVTHLRVVPAVDAGAGAGGAAGERRRR